MIMDYRMEEEYFEKSCKENCFEQVHFHIFINDQQEVNNRESKRVIKRSRDFETLY